MKNSTMKKLAGIAAIVTLASCMFVPMGMTAFASTDEYYTITINSTNENHIYEAYQIFTGDLNEGKLSNIQWGANMNGGVTVGDDSESFVSFLKADSVLNSYEAIQNLTDDSSAADVADAIASMDDSTDNATHLADVISNFLSNFSPNPCNTSLKDTETGNIIIPTLAPGYYFVKDKDDTLAGKHDAYTAYILQVVQDVLVEPKSAYPTVDKQVWDEVDDAEAGATDGWGETADHAINETFQFKLIANIAADDNLDYYDTYKLVFTDTMSTGVTFESIESVKVGNNVVVVSGYACTATEGMEGDGTSSWTLSIDDIIQYLGEGAALSDGTTVEVIYNAHLNEDAQVMKADGATTNANTVGLEYSNNPNWIASGEGDEEELGKTPEDTVWVFTYEVDNTKYKNSKADANILAGAGFTLYTDEAKNDAVKLVWNAEKGAYIVADQDSAEAEDFVTEMKSQTDGKFNIIGLDAGTYYLSETTTPAGYNTCEDIEIVIDATHKESEDGTTNSVTFTNSTKNMNNSIINKSGSTLPSTGGIGTTLFYVIGGTMAAGAGVYLISKKRMNNKQD